MSTHKSVFRNLELPTLRRVLDAADLRLVDIGGRDSAFPGVLPLAPLAHYYVCEPDAAEADRLKERLPRSSPWRSITVMNEAIGSEHGDATLHVTAEPGMSSLLEPDVDVVRRYCLRDSYAVVSRATVAMMPLDAAASRYGFADATFLKVDTQGTELDILRSGPRLVGGLLGIYTEVEFQPFYKDQPLFADVDTHLRQSGFVLFSLNRTTLRRAAYRPDLYSKRVVTWAHCLYLREPESLLTGDEVSARRNLARLLALAIAFEHYDLAFEIVALGRRVRLVPDDDSGLVADLRRIVRLATRRMLRRAQEARTPAGVLAADFRDKKQLE